MVFSDPTVWKCVGSNVRRPDREVMSVNPISWSIRDHDHDPITNSATFALLIKLFYGIDLNCGRPQQIAKRGHYVPFYWNKKKY
jgi:hypothetical protein